MAGGVVSNPSRLTSDSSPLKTFKKTFIYAIIYLWKSEQIAKEKKGLSESIHVAHCLWSQSLKLKSPCNRGTQQFFSS